MLPYAIHSLCLILAELPLGYYKLSEPMLLVIAIPTPVGATIGKVILAEAVLFIAEPLSFELFTVAPNVATIT